MIGRFWFFRRRRVLPFTALWCLVFINGAALQPFTLAPELLDGIAASSPVATAHGLKDESSRRPQYERSRRCADPEPLAGGGGGPPPIVKNLRRPAPSRTAKALVRGVERRVVNSAFAGTGRTRHAVAANTADLNRLCRLLI